MPALNTYNSLPETLPYKEFGSVKVGDEFIIYVGNEDNAPVRSGKFHRYNEIPSILPNGFFALVKEGDGFRWYVGNADNEPVPHTGGGNNTESDPTVPQHVKDITEQDIDNWNNPPSGGGSGGIQIIDAGSFTGEVNLSDGNYRYYDTYAGDSIAVLEVSEILQLGSQAVLPIPGDKISDVSTFIPEGWRYDGKELTTDATKVNELRFELGKNDLVDVVNRVFSLGNVDNYIVWEQLVLATYEGGGSIYANSPGANWRSGGYASKAINGNNAIHFNAQSGQAQIFGLTHTHSGINSSSNLSSMDILVVLKDDNTWQILESGTSKITNQTGWDGFQVGFRLTDGVVTFEIDGVTKYTSDISYTMPLTPIALFNNGYTTSKITNAEFENLDNIENSPL